MQKYKINSIAVVLIGLLAGCHARTLSMGPTFNSFPSINQNMAQSVQDALSRNPDPQVAQVHASMNQNTIILTGYVKKIRQSDTAEQIAHQVAGAQSVENNIIVKP